MYTYTIRSDGLCTQADGHQLNTDGATFSDTWITRAYDDDDGRLVSEFWDEATYDGTGQPVYSSTGQPDSAGDYTDTFASGF